MGEEARSRPSRRGMVFQPGKYREKAMNKQHVVGIESVLRIFTNTAQGMPSLYRSRLKWNEIPSRAIRLPVTEGS